HAVRVAVIDAAEAGDGDKCVGLGDGDGGVAAGGLVVGVAVEGPVHQAAGDVGVGRAGHVEQAAQIGRGGRFDAGGRAADHAVRVAVIDAAEAGDGDVGVGLGDGDGGVAAGGLVVGVAVEGPVHQAAGDVGVGRAGHVQQAAQIGRGGRFDAGGRAADHAVRVAVIDAAERWDEHT